MQYGKGKSYVVELKNKNIWYTGIIVEEDTTSIKLKTIRGETLIIAKDEILQSKEIGNSIGDKNERD